MNKSVRLLVRCCAICLIGTIETSRWRCTDLLCVFMKLEVVGSVCAHVYLGLIPRAQYSKGSSVIMTIPRHERRIFSG